MISLDNPMDLLMSGDPTAILFAFLTVLMGVSVASAIVHFSGKKKSYPAMSPIDFEPFRLSKKAILSHDTRRFTFDLQSPETRLGLPVGQHISLRFTDSEGKAHQRSYTPVTGNETPGKVSFVIKVYKADVHPKFPLGGKMSQHLDSLAIGDAVDMRGPKGHMTYLGHGKFTLKASPRKSFQERHAKHFGMIAGGTGITPMLQIMHAVLLHDPTDKTTTISLLYANQTEDDILVRDELEGLARDYGDRFKFHYTVDRPPTDGSWIYSTGFINEEMLMQTMPKVDLTEHSTQILMCGPPPMMKFACLPNLEKLGFSEDDWYIF